MYQQTLFQQVTNPHLNVVKVCSIPKDEPIEDVDFNSLNSYALPDLQQLADEYYNKATAKQISKGTKKDAVSKYNRIAEAANRKAGYKMYLIIRG